MCLFCKIARREVPSDVVLETHDILAFKDVRPVAPVHALVIPKKHLTSLGDVGIEDTELLGRLLFCAHEVADKLGLAASGYRVVLNTGRDGGQSVPHLHAHVMGGRAMAWPPG
jgi:histidine triad (HIT) family protein